MNFEQIVININAFFKKYGEDYFDYYVGVTNDAERRLFYEHNVDKDRGVWIYCKAKTDDIARLVEHFYLNKGCDGGPGGGSEDCCFFYCYKIEAHTKER